MMNCKLHKQFPRGILQNRFFEKFVKNAQKNICTGILFNFNQKMEESAIGVVLWAFVRNFFDAV